MTNRQWCPENIDRVENLTYVPLERRYFKVQFVKTAMAYIGLMLLPVFLLFITEDPAGRNTIIICAESVLLAAAAVNMLFLPKAYAYKGFAIREHDITYRSGIIFPKTVTIPFCKVQQVSVRQTPVTRMFGLYAVDIVNGAQFLAETTIPGLTKEKADRIKALLIERIDNESK